jgi:hypothetical protein
LAGRFCSGLSELKIALLGGRWGTGFQFVLRLVQAVTRRAPVRGNDWTDLYPLIVEAALHNLSSFFVIDGEALLRCVKNSREQSTGKCVTEQVTRPVTW